MKKVLKNVLRIFIIMLVTIGSVVGCSQKEETIKKLDSSSNETNQKKEKNITLTFGSHQSGLPTSGIVQELAQEFENETGIKIDFQIAPDAQWNDLLKVKMNSGEAPDIICADSDPLGFYQQFDPENNMVPLDDEEWVTRMDKNVLPSISYDGKIYGITFAGPKMYVYLYNKEIFNELGLQPPTDYEQFKNVSQKILDAGITPVYEGTTNGWHQVLPVYESTGLYTKNNPNLIEKLNNNEMTLGDIPEMELIISQMKEFADLGYFGKDYLSNAVENAKEAIATGTAAMFLSEPGWANEVETDFPEFKAENLGIFSMPWGDNQTIGVNPASNAYFINNKSKHVEEIKQFFEFLARPENLQKRLEGQAGLLQLCWPEVSSKYPKEYEDYLNSKEKALVMQVGVKFVGSGFMDTGSDLEGAFMGDLTPKDVVEFAQTRRDDQGNLQKDPAWTK